MAVKVFIEYKVKRGEREQFLSLSADLKRNYEKWEIERFGLFEGADQPLLFVEDFIVKKMDDYEQIKQERLQEKREIWKKVHQCIEGGAPKVNIWAFEAVEI